MNRADAELALSMFVSPPMIRRPKKVRLLTFALAAGTVAVVCFIVVFVLVPTWLVNDVTGPLLPAQGDHDVFAIDYRPVWSPDGMKIAFVSHDAIFVMDRTGESAKLLTSGSTRSFNPAWSPDGKQLVFVSYDNDGLSGLYTTSLENSVSKLLLDCARESWWCFNPVWSKDGSQIAWQTYRPQKDHSAGNWGSAIANVTNSQAMQVTHLITSALVSQPVWSPDGQEVALTVSGGEKKGRVLVFSKAGDQLSQLETETIGDPPSWSPEGGRLAYAADGKVCIWTVDAVELRCFTFHSAVTPVWSPDGTKIAVEDYADKSIYLLSANTGQSVFLTQGCFPDWSPDGASLAFQDLEGIATIASNGSDYTLLQTTSGHGCQ